MGRSCGKEPLMLALLPVDPGTAVVAGREPAVDRPAELGLARQARGERELVETDSVDISKLSKATEPVQLRKTVDPVPGGSPPGDDEPVLLQIPEHPRRPAAPLRGLSNSQCLHAPNL